MSAVTSTSFRFHKAIPHFSKKILYSRISRIAGRISLGMLLFLTFIYLDVLELSLMHRQGKKIYTEKTKISTLFDFM